MAEQKAVWPTILICAVLMLASACIGYSVAPEKTDTIVKTIEVPVVVSQEAQNISDLEIKVSNIETEVLREINFKNAVKALALEELENRDYKALFNGMLDLNISIDEKSDISKVVIKDVSIGPYDIDEQDAIVVQELKVYYEDITGESVKVYLTVTYTIDDLEVEELEVALTD